MDIEVKNIVTTPGSMAYHATVFIDGELAGLATNMGTGVTKIVPVNQEGKRLIYLAQRSFSLPEPDQKIINLSGFIEQKVTDRYNAIEHARLEDLANEGMVNGIVYGIPTEYISKYQYNRSIAAILERAEGVEILKRGIAKVRGLLQPGEVILSTNLPKEVLGITPLEVKKQKGKKGNIRDLPGDTSKARKR